MLETILLILLILWALGFGFSIGGSLIHLLIVVVLVIVIVDLLGGRRSL